MVDEQAREVYERREKEKRQRELELNKHAALETKAPAFWQYVAGMVIDQVEEFNKKFPGKERIPSLARMTNKILLRRMFPPTVEVAAEYDPNGPAISYSIMFRPTLESEAVPQSGGIRLLLGDDGEVYSSNGSKEQLARFFIEPFFRDL
jgi:hypothetical protein